MTPDKKLTLSEALIGSPGDGTTPGRGEVFPLFPLIVDGVFPMGLIDFLLDVKFVTITIVNGDSKLVRTIASTGANTVQLKWQTGKFSGRLEVKSNQKIEKREYRPGKCQYCLELLGTGGALWRENDQVTFSMKSGEKLSLNEWLMTRDNRSKI